MDGEKKRRRERAKKKGFFLLLSYLIEENEGSWIKRAIIYLLLNENA